MQATLSGLPWWSWVLLVLAVGVAAVLVRRSAGRSGRQQEAERLAQRADATHESARTYHEGGP